MTTPHAARRLGVLHGFRQAAGLRTWQDCVPRRGGTQVRITSLPGRPAGRAVLRGLLPPVMGSMLEFGPGDGPVRLRLYPSGDTLLHDGVDEIARRFPAASPPPIWPYRISAAPCCPAASW
ncbi:MULTISPECIES: hypothetical protein [unclassified Streptomyces]|uniref:hypothetical protein n=1 Tax=unclassified Streptomyces TaxID=2593676 RepID=UPI000A74A1E2